ncbi:hypothetical protein ACERK3_05360 [Phycisphaerales bacterium AB-hyl4]|uniref:DUF3352 domain-containing protein n=1 Tax=Natronomicrosphaera hydrolytica TaxID=3242702 RepID=A0ABV4U297_9BACT
MMRQYLLCLTVAATMVLSLTASPRAFANADAALRLVSADADVAVVVPSLASLNEQVAELRQALNLPFEEMDDIVGMMFRQAGMSDGVDNSGPMVLSIFNLGQAIDTGGRPGMTLLIPVRNYQSFVGNFDGNPRDDVAVLTMAGGQTAFSRQLDNFAVLSDQRELAEAYTADGDPAVLRAHAGSVGSKYLDEASLAVYLNLDAIGPALINLIEQVPDMLGDDFAMMTEFGMDEATVEASRAMQQLYADGSRSMIESVQSIVFAFDLTERGLGMTQTFQLRDNSPLRELFPGTPSDAASELARLPDRPFLFATAVDDRPIRFNRMIKALLGVMPEEQLAMFGPVEQSIALLDQTHAYASAFYVPDQAAMMGGGLLNMLSTYRVEDTDAYLAAWRNTIEQMDEQEVDLPEGVDGQPAGTVSFRGTYTDDALQIDGVQIAQYQIQFDMPAELMQQMDNPFAAGMGAMSYGGYIAGKGDHIIMTTTTDPQIMRAALRALDQPTGIGAAGAIADIRDHAMPPNAAAESYVSLQGMAQMGNLLLMMFGGEPIEVPADVPPIAMGLGVEDDGVALRLFVPTGAMKAVGDAVEQLAPLFGAVGPMMPTQQQDRDRRPPY